MNISGSVAPGFEPVRDAFARNFSDGLELGAGFAAWLGDEKVVDLCGGYRDRRGGEAVEMREWHARTLCPVYSVTKPVSALVVAMLVDQGRLDYDAPVADVWPEFAAEGKGSITLAEALSHQGGLPGFAQAIDAGLWLDPPALAAELARLKPMWGHGEGSGYHPLTWGYIVGEVVRRASGRTLGAILREHVCAPSIIDLGGIDFWIGLPEAEHHRVAQVMKPKEPTKFGEPNEALRAAFLVPWAVANRGGADWRMAEIPSANGHGTALATARLYSAFAGKGVIGGKRLFSEETWEELTRPRVSGRDRILPGRVAFGAGVMLNLPLIYGPNPDTLCHSGWGGSGAFGDPALGLSAAYVMNRQGNDLLEDDRRTRLIEALYTCV